MLDDGVSRRLLLIESHAGLRRDLERALSLLGFSVEGFASARHAMTDGDFKPSAVQVIELEAAGADPWLAAHGSTETTIVLVSDPGSLVGNRSTTTQGMELLAKPFSIQTLEARVLARLSGLSVTVGKALDPILETKDPEVVSLLGRARRLARRGLPLVIEGELGTGRRALAESIHRWSARAGSSLLTVERIDLEAEGLSNCESALDDVMSQGADGSVMIVDPADWPEPLQDALIARSLPARTAAMA